MLKKLFDDCVQIATETQASDEHNIPSPLPTCKGVILFANSQDKPIQLLLTANIRRAAKTKLQAQDAETRTKRADIAAITDRIYYSCCYNDFRSSRKYNQLARSLYPRNFPSIMNLPKQTFVKIDMTQRWPYFSLTENPLSSDDKKVFGPFPTRRSANELIQTLHDVFMLCQRPDLIAGRGNLASCPYYQMSSCPAPCINDDASTDYHSRVKDAISAVSSNVDTHIFKLEEQMNTHAAKMEFEQANQCKNAAEKLTLLKKYTYHWTTELTGVAVLHIDRSAKISVKGKRKKQQTYSAFLIRPDQTFEFADFTIDDLGQIHSEVCDMAKQPLKEQTREQLTENTALLSYFLYKNNRPGIWIDCSTTKSKTIPSQQEILAAICRRFDIEPDSANESDQCNSTKKGR